MSEHLRAPISEHAAASSTQPCPPAPLPSSDDVPILAPTKTESANLQQGQLDGGTLEGEEQRAVVDAESAVSSAAPAALAAPLSPAATVGPSRAASDAPAPRKKRSRPFNIPRS